MEITSKGRYAVRVMADIAKTEGEFVSLSDIAKRQTISIKYLEKIVAMLSKAKLVESLRGANGGYRLARQAKNITIKEILDATGEEIKLTSCASGKDCPKAQECDTMGIWLSLNNLISDFLSSVTLKDLIDKTFQNKILIKK